MGKSAPHILLLFLLNGKNSHSGYDEDNKINITKVEYDKKHIFNNKVFHRRIKHVRT